MPTGFTTAPASGYVIGMEVVLILAFVAVAGAVGTWAHVTRRAALRRTNALLQTVRARGWHLTRRDDSYARRWKGRPFRGNAGHASPIVHGRHRERDFVAFEYSYSTKPTPNADTAITHRFAVCALPLPTAVPTLSVRGRGILGPTAAKALGTAEAEIGDEEFRRLFVVHCADESFAVKVLQAPLTEYLKTTGQWEWRFEGDTMLAWDTGRLEPDWIGPKLDLMTGVLDHVSADAWRHG